MPSQVSIFAGRSFDSHPSLFASAPLQRVGENLGGAGHFAVRTFVSSVATNELWSDPGESSRRKNLGLVE